MGRSRSRERRRGRSRERRSRSRRRSDNTEKAEAKAKVEEIGFKPGQTVVVHGLQKNPEKNGAIGKLVSFNQEKGRWLVEFSSSSNNFKEENLEVMADTAEAEDDNEEPPTAKLYITNLSAETTEKDLIELFKSMGVLQKQVTRDNRGNKRGFQDQWPDAVKLYKPGKPGGDGSVEYQDKYAAKAAIKTYNGYRLKGSKIGVAYAGQGRKYEPSELTLPWAERPENQGKIRDD